MSINNEDEDLSKHTLFLFEGDYDKLKTLFPERGAAYVVRRLVRSFIERVEEDQPVLDKYIDIKFD